MTYMDIVDKLLDLQRQATLERSHYYVASCVTEAIQEIVCLRKKVDRLNRVVCGERPRDLLKRLDRDILSPDYVSTLEILRRAIRVYGGDTILMAVLPICDRDANEEMG